MLEVLINNPSDRQSGVMNSSTAYNGSFCWISGFNADGEPLLNLPQSSAESVKALYPVNKYYYEEDLNDTSDAVDLIVSGKRCMFYQGEGQYITDRFVKSSISGWSGLWADIEGSVSSTFGKKITSPGTSTANATLFSSLQNTKLWVATGTAVSDAKEGYLTATSGSVGFASGTESSVGYVARVVGIFGADSADAKLRFKLEPHQRANVA